MVISSCDYGSIFNRYVEENGTCREETSPKRAGKTCTNQGNKNICIRTSFEEGLFREPSLRTVDFVK